MPDPPTHDPMKLAHAQEALDHLDQVENQLNQTQDGLEHLHRLATLGILSAKVAHELNNILTPVIGYAQLALSSPDDRALTQKALEKSQAGAQRASQILNSLLGHAREEDDSASADLNQAVHSALGCLTHSLDRDNIQLSLDIEDLQIKIPQINLEQVLLNLILNARKAMAKQGGSLAIRAWSHEDTAHIKLSDTGGGVPPQIAEHLFEPFTTHPHTDDQATGKGTGLGLSICKDMIINAGGQIDFDTTPGQGTTFHLHLPKAQPLQKSA